MDGGKGEDAFWGGPEADLFDFHHNYGGFDALAQTFDDLIFDYVDGVDKLGIPEFGTSGLYAVINFNDTFGGPGAYVVYGKPGMTEITGSFFVAGYSNPGAASLDDFFGHPF